MKNLRTPDGQSVRSARPVPAGIFGYIFGLILYSICLAGTSPTYPQSGKLRENDRPFSVATPPSHPFISTKGKFSIDLPKTFSKSTPIKIEGPADKITGETFEWDTTEGQFTVMYIDTPSLISGSVAAQMGLDTYRRQTLTQIARSKGTIISDNDILISGVPGAEIKADMLGSIYTFRGCVTGRRLYEWMVAAPKSPGVDPAITDRIMGSFKLIDDRGAER